MERQTTYKVKKPIPACLARFTPEYRFDRKRNWRFDYALPEQGIAVEIEGGTWAQGRHVRGQGYENDCRKYNAAALQGWLVFRFTTKMVSDGTLEQTITEALERVER